MHRAQAGAGLVMTEFTAASAEGRITPADAGMYTAEQGEAWATIVEPLHATSSAKIGIRLSHAGRRGSTRPRSEGLDRPLRQCNWPLLSASPLPYTPQSQIPAEMDREAMDRGKADFVQATKIAPTAGFALLQL